MKTKTIKAFAPATVANVSCGFDVFGFAVNAPGDEVEITLTESKKVIITSITGDNGLLPLDASKNTVGVAVQEFLKSMNSQHGAEIVLHKNLPLGSGMGSSAASAVAALVGVNHALGNPLSRKELLPFAVEAERIACGSAHADNVAPCLIGGFVLIRNQQELDVIEIPVPKELVCVLVHPHIEIKTRDARQVMKTMIPLKDATMQWGNTAGLIAGLMKEDYALIGRSLHDVVAEPARSQLIPSYDVAKAVAMNAGSLGCGISGSGPTLFALCKGEDIAGKTAEAIQATFSSIGLKSEYYISSINKEGAKIIES
jgi:homoserine kinase